MNCLFQVNALSSLLEESLIRWKSKEIIFEQSGFFALVEKNHSYNYLLWHEEDKARRDDLGYEFVYRAKRNIDHYNQQRNNFIEAMDKWLFSALTPENSPECPIHSETPGMIIDRLSILTLKKYHMGLQVERVDVETTHKAMCYQKWQTIMAQRDQLIQCLELFIQNILQKKCTFKLFYQFKMYNDPTLNPELYGQKV